MGDLRASGLERVGDLRGFGLKAGGLAGGRFIGHTLFLRFKGSTSVLVKKCVLLRVILILNN